MEQRLVGWGEGCEEEEEADEKMMKEVHWDDSRQGYDGKVKREEAYDYFICLCNQLPAMHL